MADNTATQRRATTDVPVSHGGSGVVLCLPATVELAASASGDTVDFGKIPSNARILVSSRLYNDDLATSGSPTLDIGLKSYTGSGNSITASPDAIGNGFALSSAGSDVVIVSDVANIGKRAWELAGLSTDPGGSFELYGTVKGAATTATGTVSLEMHYTLD